MKGIVIGRPDIKDKEQINEFFEMMLKYTFESNGIGDLEEIYNEEIVVKAKYLEQDLQSEGSKRYFLVAKFEENIVGTIEYGPSNDLINTFTNGEYKDIVEIGTVFVHPAFQRKGIASRMLEHMYTVLKEKGITEFCLDSGYKNAQQTWQRKFGKPIYNLKDYWSEGNHHMIWRLEVVDLITK